MLILIFIILLLKTSVSEQNNLLLNENIGVLTENLIGNLRVDPYLIDVSRLPELPESAKEFIDRRIEQYSELVQTSQQREYSRSKRTFQDGSESNEKNNIVEISPYHPSLEHPSDDIRIFQQNERMYAVVLQKTRDTQNDSDRLIVIKNQGDVFKVVDETIIQNCARVATFSLKNSTLIVAAQSNNVTKILEFDVNNKLRDIQTIQKDGCKDIAVWEDNGNVFMSLVGFMGNSPVSTSYFPQLYKWRGRHFDDLQDIRFGATRISPFMIGGAGFIAIAYNVSENGKENENVYSEILKYNLNTEKYEFFQKILTFACDEIKYLEIDSIGGKAKSEKEKFLIVANSFKKDSSGRKYEKAPSIIYKFVDDYFYPFQCISHSVLQWEIVKNQHGDVLLVALTTDGIKSFQYDGWNFIETEVNFQEKSINNVDMFDVKTMHTFIFKDEPFLVLVRTDPTKRKPGIFKINFSKNHQLQKLHDRLLKWCQRENQILTEADNILREASDNGLGLQRESQTQSLNLETLISTISTYNSKMSSIQNTLKTQFNNFIKNGINATLLLINSNATFESLVSDKINHFETANILKNKVDIYNEIDLNNIKADFLRFNSSVLFNSFNNHSQNTLIYTTDSNKFRVMVIKGNAIFNDSIAITNTLNNINITRETILLSTGDQNLHNLRVSRIDADRVNVGAINGKLVDEVIGKAIGGNATDISEASEESNDNNLKEKVKRFEEIKVRNLIVGGLINDVDIPTLEKYALRKAGKQNITQTYNIDNVETKRVDTDKISGKQIPEDLITINEKSISLKSANFKQPVRIEKLQVKEHLNTIPVTERGNLDVIFKQSSVEQLVTASKSFDYLNILNSIDIQEKVDSSYFDSINPMRQISSDLVINKTITIKGNVTVEKLLKAVDIVPNKCLTNQSKSHNRFGSSSLNVTDFNSGPQEKSCVTTDSVSMVKILKSGIKLNDTNITIPFQFKEDMVAKNVYTKSINNLDPSKFVIAGSEKVVKIKGIKSFTKNLTILGDTVVDQVNGMTVSDMEKNILKTVTDQILRGEYHVRDVIIKGRLKTNSTTLGNNLWKNVVTQNGDQHLKGNWMLTNLIANSTKVDNVNLQGLVNGLNLSRILEDAVFIEDRSKIFGTKNFQTLNVTNLWINNSFDLNTHITDIVDGKIVLQTVKHFDSLSAEKVYFQNKCNEIDKFRFGNTSLSETNETLNIDDKNVFDKIIVKGSVYLESNKLNEVDIEDFSIDTVKIDEPTYFETADFGKSVAITPLITHHGQIENLDLDNVFGIGKNQTEIAIGKNIFKEDIFVNGTVTITDYLNEINISQLCGILSEFKTPKNLIIQGNVHFTKGPKLRIFNGHNTSHLKNDVWFTDDPVSLSGNIIFKNNVILRDILTLEGFLNDMHLDNLSKNYLSKTKSQSIEGHINLNNNTVFKDEVVSPKVAVGGLINSIKLDTFLKSTLLHRPQLFEDMLYFEEVSAKHLEGNYLVNKLNLDSEVMRYDRPNLITGSKKFENLNIDVLRPEREETPTRAAKVQGVDVTRWLQNAVLNKGSFKIEGKKMFNTVEVKEEISIMGHFNGIKFDERTTMMKHLIQNITGKKTFKLKPSSKVTFGDLKLKGLVNDEHLEKVLNNRAYQNEDNTFLTDLQFCNNITAKNVEFKRKISGIDVSELLQNITALETLNHIKGKYKNLNDMADQVETSLKGQAYFLDYYKPVFMTFKVNEMFAIECSGSGRNIISFTNDSDSNIFRLLDWDERQEIFRNISIERNVAPYPNYINKITMENTDRVYLEKPISEDSDSTHTGRFMICNNNKLELTPGSFLTKGTRSVTTFQTLPKTWCLLFVDFNFDINILCRKGNETFTHQHTIKNESPVMAHVVTINNRPILITTQGGNDKKTVFWIWNNKKFEIFQTTREGEPIDISSVSTEKETILAIAYKHLPNTKDYGKVVIRRIRKFSKSPSVFQKISILTPTNIELTILPSKEIALYIITENPSEPLAVYLYKGVEGFVKKIGHPTLSVFKDVKSFSLKNQHFVMMKNDREVKFLQAIFKGSKFNDL